MLGMLSLPAESALRRIAAVETRTTYPELAVLRVPSIVESYVDDLLDILSAEYVKGDSDFQWSLQAVTDEKLHQNWNTRREWLRDAFHIDVGKTAEAQDFFLLVELRNALVHGGDGLTRSQRRRLRGQLALERDLRKRLNAFVDGQRTILTDATARAAVQVGSRYVRALDTVAREELVRRELL